MLTALTQGGEAIRPDQAVEHLRDVTFRWPHNFFEFEFAALSYSRPEKNQYAYKLEGLDKDWVYVGSKRFGRYTNLSGGTYTLRIRGSNNDGIWNEAGATLNITVVPPFWATWWFRALVGLGGVAVILSLYRVRVKTIATRNRELEIQVARRTVELRREIEQRMRIEAELRDREMEEAVAAERSRLARELHDAVTQTLFSASIIAEAVPVLWEMNPDEGRRRLIELRRLNRGALAEMRTLLLELRPAALVETGLEELLRQLGDAVGGRSGVAITVTVEGRCTIPADVHITLYRIAQEALNNVVKHANASEVTVNLACLNGSNDNVSGEAPPGTLSGVKLCVADDGCGFDLSCVSHEGLGLSIMRERAQAIGATLDIVSQPGYGTQVVVIWQSEERLEVVDGREGELYEYAESHSSYARR